MTVAVLPEAFAAYCSTLDLAVNTPEWERERSNGLGASDMSTVLGLNPWKDRHGLWLEKTLGIRESENWRMVIGHALEPVVRDKFVLDTGIHVVQHPMVQSLSHPFLRYTPDGFTEDGGLFEAKTTSWHLGDQWADDQVADHAEIQVQAGMFVTGAPHAWVAAMVDADPDRFHVRRVERDDGLIEDMVAVASQFWHEYVLANVEPPLTAVSLPWVKQEFSEVEEDESVDLGGAGAELVAKLQEAKRVARAAEKEADGYEAELRRLVGNAAEVWADGSYLGKRKKVTSKRLDQKLMVAAGLDPDEFRSESSYTRFYWQGGK